MTKFYAPSASELTEAMNNAVGGDEIILSQGDYGSFRITQKFSSPVTLTGELGTFENLRFDGASNVVVRDTTITNGVYIIRSQNISLLSNYIDSNDAHALIINPGSHNIEVSFCKVFGAAIDLVRLAGDVDGVLIEYNIISDPVPTNAAAHPDLIQGFGYKDFTPKNIVIRKNILFDSLATGVRGVQGIFLSDGLYENVLIEQNLLFCTMTNGITIQAAKGNVVVRDNTVLSGIIRASNKGENIIGNSDGAAIFEGNIARSKYNLENNVDWGSNYLFGGGDENRSAVFSDPSDPSDFRAYLPKPGSPIDFGSAYGAQEFLLELLDGQKLGPMMHRN